MKLKQLWFDGKLGKRSNVKKKINRDDVWMIFISLLSIDKPPMIKLNYAFIFLHCVLYA